MSKQAPAFLQGGGEMGELIRNHNWEDTPLGKPENWPHSLKTIVGLLLHSAFPMFLFWGKDLLCFYNDAYRPSLGNDGKHPFIAKKGKDSWAEIWHFIGPLIDNVMKTGEAVWFEDQFLPIYRNGKMEDVYWTFSYSPAYGDDSSIQGVFVTCTETTSKVIALSDLKATNERIEKSQEELVSYFEQSPVAVATISKENLTFRLVNPFYAELVGRTPEEIKNKPLLEALPELKGQGFDDLLREVISTGRPFIADEVAVDLKRNGAMETIYVNLAYQPQRNTTGEVIGILVVATDVTLQVRARKEVEKSEARFRSLIEEAPVATCLFTGREQKIALANDLMLSFWGKGSAVIGMRLEDAVPELKGQPFLQILDDVFTSGKPYSATAARAELEVGGVLGTYYFNFTYKPLFDEEGEVYGIIDMAIDVTEQVLAGQKLEESGARLKTVIAQTPAPTLVLMGDELVVEQVNAAMLQLLGRGKEIVGIPLIATMPELEGQYIWEQVKKVYWEGKPFDQSEVHVPHRRNGEMQDFYYNIAYRPLTEEGKIIGMIQVAIDVTEQVISRRKIEESEAHLQLTRNAIPAMVFYLDEAQRYRSYNEAFMAWFKVNGDEALGKTVREFIGDAAYTKAGPLLAKAYAGEHVEYHMHAPSRIEGEKWLNISYTPHKNVDGKVVGVFVHATDITEHMIALKKIEESESRFRGLLQEAPMAATLFKGPELIIEVANDLTLKYWGKNSDIIGKPLAVAVPELEDQEMIALVKGIYERGGMASFSERPIRFMDNGVMKNGFYSFSLKALYDTNGEVESVLSTGIEVSEQVSVRKKIEQSEKELRDLIAASPIGICVLTGDPVWVEEVNERFLMIAGKTRDEFEKAPYWEVMGEIAHEFEPILDKVFKTGVRYTSEEREMVLVRGGVPEKIYTTFEYMPVFDENHRVTKVILIAVEVSHQVEIRKEIEDAVVSRTKELAESNLQLRRSNEELEQFAYIASHDLQEPIRKISNFTQLLEHSLGEIGAKSKDYVSKIYSSTDRMSKLIRDVLAYSRIGDRSNEFESVDLNAILDAVKVDFELPIANTQASIEIDGLPTIRAIPSQMMQLFGNLMSNALKYRRAGTKPVIRISCAVAKTEKVMKRLTLDFNKAYYHIEFSDNGIGFSEEHVDKIFRIFQRLHGKTEYEGTGIGLAICLKIVNNHGGHISAAVGENGGALFNILLPVQTFHKD